MTTTIHDGTVSECAIIRDILWSIAEKEISRRKPDAAPRATPKRMGGGERDGLR